MKKLVAPIGFAVVAGLVATFYMLLVYKLVSPVYTVAFVVVGFIVGAAYDYLLSDKK